LKTQRAVYAPFSLVFLNHRGSALEGSSTHRHAANEQYGTESLGIRLEKKAELYSSSTYELVRADFLADVLYFYECPEGAVLLKI
jgi:hypothetical protein